MNLIDELLDLNKAARIVEIEQRESGSSIKGDFEGSVTGVWVKLDDYGRGIVSYKNKTYRTKTIGFTSISAGKPVQLSYANGIYYSAW